MPVHLSIHRPIPSVVLYTPWLFFSWAHIGQRAEYLLLLLFFCPFHRFHYHDLLSIVQLKTFQISTPVLLHEIYLKCQSFANVRKISNLWSTDSFNLLIFFLKFKWHKMIHACLHVIYEYFCSLVAELSSCHKDYSTKIEILTIWFFVENILPSLP